MAVGIIPIESAFQRLTRVVALYLVAPLLALATLPVSVHVLQKPDLGMSVHRLQVQDVAVGGPAYEAGIQAGDRILAIDRAPTDRMVDWFAAMAGHYGLDARDLTVERDGRVHSAMVHPRRPGRSRMVFELSLWLAGLLFLLIGWWVYSQRHDAVGRNFFSLCLIFAFFLADIPDLPAHRYLVAKQLLRELFQYLWPVYFLRFFLMFPAPAPVTSDRGDRLLFLPAGILIALTVIAHWAGIGESSLAAGLLQGAGMLHFFVFFVIGLVVFARKVLRRDRPILHTKLRVILLGLVTGVVPFLVTSAVGIGSLPAFPNWEYLGFSLLLVPVSFGLAIMRYGALDTAFVVRTSLVYGLLTALILGAYVLGAGLLGSVLRNTYAVSTYPVLVVVVAACSLAVLPLRRRVQDWVDHAFYPSRRAGRRAVSHLGRALAIQVNVEEAHAMLLARLNELYRPECLGLYLATAQDSPFLAAVGWRPKAARPDAVLQLDGTLLTSLDRLRRPVCREEFEDLDRAFEGGDGPWTALPPGVELLVPLITGNTLSGLLAFGPKTCGSVYTQEDLANLATLSLQTAPLLESLRLHANVLRQRQLETELTVARDMQAQLLPTAPLEIDGVHLSGRNDPCRHVGGDYYDYFPLVPDQSLGFCIADVAGKGIPAALLMTTLRVTFRELAVPDATPEQVATELDRRLGEILSPGRFVSFFYGTLDHVRGLLTYCNAGMEPPLLYRQGRPPETLDRGGPILGINAGVPYRSGTVRLQPGDLILGYTDGITEQTSPDGTEFFEVERLQAMVAGEVGRPPAEICRLIFDQVEAFGGAAVSDDRTVIVLKYR